MKITLLKHLLLAALLLSATSEFALATTFDPNPRRRKGAKTEKSEVKQDSTEQNTQNTTAMPSSATESNNKEADSNTGNISVKHVRPNTIGQIDSVLALWKTSNTHKMYEQYFDGYLNLTKRMAANQPSTNMDSVYIARLEALMSPVPLKYNPEVRDAIERFATKYYAPVFSLAYYYFPMIEEELTRAGLPIELRTLAVIESGLDATAISKMGAGGIWQFMPATGKAYGLEINSLVDERCDPRLSTQAACRFLKHMYSVYGDWTLALASYNTGPGNVNKAIIRAGGDPKKYKGSFWDVYEYLPEETRLYVPYYMGATYAFAYLKAHDIEVPMPPMPIAVDTIMINRPMHLKQISSTINIKHEVLTMLNPQYLMEIIPATSKQYALTLPIENISEYLEHEKDIYAKDSTYLKEYVIQVNLERQRKVAPQFDTPKTTTKYHTVVEGETLGSIARKYNVTVKQLIAWNKLENPDALSLGQKLRVTVATTSKSAPKSSSTSKSSAKTHTIAEGDTLSSLAVKYGVSVKQLTEWNKIEDPNALRLGQTIRLTAPSSSTSASKSSNSTKGGSKYHTVTEGDTLGAIAVKYKVTVKQLVEWNKLDNPDALRLGQTLRVTAK